MLHAPLAVLKKSPVHYDWNRWGIDWRRLRRAPPAVRFQAHHSNALWPFDISPSDLKRLPSPAWLDDPQGHPPLMLSSVVDDRSGVASQEEHCTYGEAVETAVQLLFNAMTAKAAAHFPFCGRPLYLSAANGPVTQSQVFERVMESLGLEVRTPVPAGQDGQRTTARAQGKGERPFRTVTEVHATFYHCQHPQSEAEANAWLVHSRLRYNDRPHRPELHARMEDWVQHVPPEGGREMCSGARWGAVARAPETRKVAVAARVSVAGMRYEVEPDLVGETVTVWFGVSDHPLYVEHGDKRAGPYTPMDGPMPLHRYRRFNKTRSQHRGERIEDVAEPLALPRAALSAYPGLSSTLSALEAVP